MAKKKQQQQTLEDTLGQPRVKQIVKRHKKSGAAPTSSASPSNSPVQTRPLSRSRAKLPSSSVGGPKTVSFNAPPSSSATTKNRSITVLESSSDDYDDDDDDVVLPSSVMKRRRPPRKQQKSESDSDDVVLPSSAMKKHRPPPRKHQQSESSSDVFASPKKTGLGQKVDSEEDDDDDVVLPASSAMKRRPFRPLEINPASAFTSRKRKHQDSDGDDDDDDEKPLVTPMSVRQKKRIVVLDDSEDEDQLPISSPTKRRRLVRRGLSSPVKSGRGEEEDNDGIAINTPRAPSSSAARRKPRTEKEKARELLRRKRAGETIDEIEEEDEDEDEEPTKALYDSDSDHLALKEFEDDDEGVLQFEAPAASQGTASSMKKKKDKSPKKGKNKAITIDSSSSSDDNLEHERGIASASDEEGEEGSEDDFVVEDAPLGVPDDALMEMIPLQFTRHSHKPLKEHFRDVVEWIVQFKINPGFTEKNHEMYRMGWQKLDDEVRGLAQSKFASSAWRTDFYMALRARPYFEHQELVKGDVHEMENCGACGRSGHPAKWLVQFSGEAYYKSATSDMFLEAVEVGSSSSDDDEGDGEGKDVDEDGSSIPRASRRWFVGSVCNANAETAHQLIHWKHELLDWVDANLVAQGYMTPAKLAERQAWKKPKKKYKLVDEILERWVQEGVIRRIFKEFKDTIERARNQSTSGRNRSR
ncbi:hypothetical protein B0H66DRAFT_601651 [Apodospora peruviana]|uniref:DUF4211 domain-containing protein n=1 Tax=Apodospora peruviana TaxID=516989 RepID=A0AAE0IBN4_9PEZI|nr:hypothetical protein B0H66DRAFT_601651 [Apodospora peruviana]